MEGHLPNDADDASFTSIIDWDACEGAGGWTGTTLIEEPEELPACDSIWGDSLWSKILPKDSLAVPFVGGWATKADDASPVSSTTATSSRAVSLYSESYVEPRSTWSSSVSALSKSITEISIDPNNNDSAQSCNSLCCPWPECSRLPPFDSLDALERHVKVRHSDPKPFTWASSGSRLAKNSTNRSVDLNSDDSLNSESAFNCPRCLEPRSFRRRYELDRHIRSRHLNIKPVECPLSGCFRGQGRTSFAREDKLTAHLRSSHVHVNQWPCPVQRCRINILATELMYVHLGWHLQRTQLPQARAMYNALSPAYRCCPLWNCRMQVKQQNLLSHILDHSEDEIQCMTEALQFNSLVFEEGNLNRSCPICPFLTPSLLLLQQHLAEEHIHKDINHVTSWRQYIQGQARLSLTRKWSAEDWSFIWEPWPLFRKNYKPSLVLYCPVCKTEVPVGDSGSITHHMDMLASDEHVKPHRQQLLRIWPEFATHRVFDDLRHDGLDVHESTISQYNFDKSRDSVSGNVTRLAYTGSWTGDSLPVSAPPGTSALVQPSIKSETISQDVSSTHTFSDGHSRGTIRHDSKSTPSQAENDPIGPSRTSTHMIQTASKSSYNELWHECPQEGCGKVFPRPRDLRLHQRIHVSESERPCGCLLCGARFLSPKDLRRHSSVHEGEDGRQYKCAIESCKYNKLGFTRKDNLMRHQARSHGIGTVQ